MLARYSASFILRDFSVIRTTGYARARYFLPNDRLHRPSDALFHSRARFEIGCCLAYLSPYRVNLRIFALHLKLFFRPSDISLRLFSRSSSRPPVDVVINLVKASISHHSLSRLLYLDVARRDAHLLFGFRCLRRYIAHYWPLPLSIFAAV